jgi:hypothetical protein
MRHSTADTRRLWQAAILFAQLDQVKQNVASLRDMIESRGTGQEYVDSLRNTMDTVENEIYVVRQVSCWKRARCAHTFAVARSAACAVCP